MLTAEFRGPGIHHTEDSPDDYDMDVDPRTKEYGGRSGRIILLGDGTEVLTDSAENSTDMFDDAEDKDLESQVNKGQGNARSEREGTPGPGEDATNSRSTAPRISQEPSSLDDSPISNKTGGPDKLVEPNLKAASDSPLSTEQQQKLETS